MAFMSSVDDAELTEIGEDTSPTTSPIKQEIELTDIWATKMLP